MTMKGKAVVGGVWLTHKGTPKQIIEIRRYPHKEYGWNRAKFPQTLEKQYAPESQRCGWCWGRKKDGANHPSCEKQQVLVLNNRESQDVLPQTPRSSAENKKLNCDED